MLECGTLLQVWTQPIIILIMILINCDYCILLSYLKSKVHRKILWLRHVTRWSYINNQMHDIHMMYIYIYNYRCIDVHRCACHIDQVIRVGVACCSQQLGGVQLSDLFPEDSFFWGWTVNFELFLANVNAF